MGSNNLNRVEVSVNQTGKEDTINNSMSILDGALSDSLSIVWAGATALKTLTTAQMQEHVLFKMDGATSAGSPVLKLANNQRGIILIQNNLAHVLTVEDYTTLTTVSVGIGLTVAILATATGVKAIFVPAASGGTLATLSDGPGTLTGSAGKLVKVDSGETTWSFIDPKELELLNYKKACRVATTANITIATALNNGDALDGVTLATGDRVLVKNQTAPAENGIYVVGVVPARSTDFDVDAEIKGGTIVAVSEGTAGGNAAYMLTTNDPITVTVTGLVFATFGGGAGVSAFTGLSDVPASYTSKKWFKVRVNTAVNGLEFVQDDRQLAGSFGGVPGASVVVYGVLPAFAMDFPAGMTGSIVLAKTAATAQTDFDLRKNGVSVGTIRFAAAGTIATYVGVSAWSVDGVDDYIELVSPGSPDATLANLFITLVGAIAE